MLTVVPTYRRHSSGEAQTFAHVPVSYPLTLVVRAEEHVAYAEMLERMGRVLDVIWPIASGEVSGIATTRQWIVREAQRRGHDRVVMMDDDLHFIVRGRMEDPADDVHLRPCDEDDFRSLMAWFGNVLTSQDEPDGVVGRYAHAAVSMREGNNRLPGLGAFMKSSRGIRVVGYDLGVLRRHGLEFRGAVEGREDLDMTLQLLRHGYPNIVTYHWAQGQRSAGAPGGLEGMRDGAQLDATAERLADLHPGLVRLRTKTNVSGAMAGERTEVTISWKRALADGLAARAAS